MALNFKLCNDESATTKPVGMSSAQFVVSHFLCLIRTRDVYLTHLDLKANQLAFVKYSENIS